MSKHALDLSNTPGVVPAPPERRYHDRRWNKRLSRFTVRAFAIHRAFEFATALSLLQGEGLAEEAARSVLVAREDRRKRRGRRIA